MSLRKEFVLKALGKEAPITELCKQYGVSRKTAYKWIRRFRTSGIAGLADESRRPQSSPAALKQDLRAEIVRLRKAHPTWGAKKLRSTAVRTSTRIISRLSPSSVAAPLSASAVRSRAGPSFAIRVGTTAIVARSDRAHDREPEDLR